MRFYQTESGTAVDLDHVLAVGPVIEDFRSEPPYFYRLTLAFGSSTAICYQSREEADSCRAQLMTLLEGAGARQVRAVQAQPASVQVPQPAAPVQAQPFVPSPPPQEDEVAALLRQHQQLLATQQAAPVSPAKTPGGKDNGGYVSSFI